MDIGTWSRQQASECIEELGSLVDGGGKGSFQDASQLRFPNGSGNGGLSRDAQVRLGLAAKLVHHAWTGVGRSVFERRDSFKNDVMEMYAVLAEVEQHLCVGGGA
jgi:hypothetical protein